MSDSELRCRFDEVAELGQHRDAWDGLVDASALPSPFLKSWWLENAAEGQPVFVLCTGAQGRLLGGAAFERDHLGRGPLRVMRLRSVGQGVLAPDHIDVVGAPEHRDRIAVGVARWLHRSGAVIDLDGLSEQCRIPTLLAATTIESEPAPYLELSTLEVDRPLAGLPGRLRSTIKRSGKRLQRAGFEVRKVHGGSPVEVRDDALESLFRLHEERWQESSALSSGALRLRASLRAGLVAGEVVIHELADDQRVVASEVELIAGTRACFYQAGRLTDHEFRGSGSVLKAAVLDWALESAMTEFDFLRGDESYKADWTSTSREVSRVRAGSGPFASGVATGMNLWVTAAPKVASARSRLGRLSPSPSRPGP